MSLEFRQLLNNELITGAAVLGAGRTLGFTDDETIDAKRATLRREQRRKRQQRAEREGNRAAAEAYLAQNDAEFNQKARMTDSELARVLQSNVSADIDDEGWAFGEDTTSFVRGEGRRPQDDDQSYTRAEKVRNDTLASEFLTDNELAEQNEGRGRAQTGLGGMRDALARLEQAKSTFGFDAFGAEGAEMERLYYRLRDELGDRQQLARSKREAAFTAREDQRRLRGDVSDAAIDDAVARVVRNADLGKNEVIIGDKRSPRKQLEQRVRADLLERRIDGQIGGPARRRGEIQGNVGREVMRTLASAGIPMQMDPNNIVEITSLGGAGHASHDPNYKAAGNYQVIRSTDPSTFGVASPLYNKDGQITAYYGLENKDMVELGEVNINSTDQAINAPKPTPGQSWVSQYLPTYGKPGGTTFGYPQVGINEEMSLLGDRIRGMGYGYDNIGNPRTLAEFEKAMGAIVARGAQRGDTFWRFDPEAKKTVAVEQPGVDDVLYKLGYSDNEKSRLANALFQTQAASVVDVNQADKQAFYNRANRTVNERGDVNLDVAELRPDQGTALDKIKNEKVGRGKKRQSVRAGLAAIDGTEVVEALAAKDELMVRTPDGRQVLSPEAARAIAGAKEARGDAQMPLYGNVAGDQVDKTRFIRGTDRNTGLSTLVERYGPKQGEVAAEVERRYLEDQRLRGEAAGRTTDPIAAEQRKRDADIATKSSQMRYDDEIREKQELIKLIKRGATSDAGFDLGGTVDGKPRVIPAAPAGRKLEVPEFGAKPFTIGGSRERFLQNVQPVRQAPAPTSIAPTPGAPTGNQPAPMIDAGGGGQQPPRRPTAVGGPMPDDMRRELFSLPSKGGLMAEPDQPKSNREDTVRRIKETVGRGFDKAKDFATNPKYQRGRRIGYGGAGAAAILGTILNMGDNKEEEEMVR